VTLQQAVGRLVIVGALLEGGIAVAALLMDGPMAMAAALVGAGIAFGAQTAAVVTLHPAMKGPQAEFQKRWVMGMAIRFGSFIALATLMIVLKDTLPPAWMGGGYLGTLLVLLFAETRFLT